MIISERSLGSRNKSHHFFERAGCIRRTSGIDRVYTMSSDTCALFAGGHEQRIYVRLFGTVSQILPLIECLATGSSLLCCVF